MITIAVKRRKNVVSTLFDDYTIMIMGEEKSGKTSLFYETMLAKYGNTDAGAIYAFEKGYSHLNDALVPTVEDDNGNEKPMIDDWEDFVEIVDDMVENRYTEWEDTKVVLFDTADRYYKLAEKYTLEVSNKRRKVGSPKAFSMNDAFGGYGKGGTYQKDIVYEQFQRLKSAGYGIWFTAHTRHKNIKTKGQVGDDGYDVLGSHMGEALYKNLAQDCDFIIMITKDNEVKAKKLEGTSRKLRFTSDGYYTCGSRFSKYLPEEIDFSTAGFLEAFENAVMAAGNFSKDDFIKEIEKQRDLKDNKAKKFIEIDKVETDNRKRSDLVDKIAEMVPELPLDKKKIVSDFITKNGAKSINELKDIMDVESLQSMYDQLLPFAKKEESGEKTKAAYNL